MPIWYPGENTDGTEITVFGRGIGNASTDYWNQLPDSDDVIRKRLAAAFVSTPHHDPATFEHLGDPLADMLAQDIAYLTYDYADGRVMRRPSYLRSDDGSAARSGDSFGHAAWTGRCGHDCFEFDRGQPSEGGLASAAVVGAFDPGDDGDPQLFAGVPAAAVQDVLLQQAEEALHGGVVAGRPDATHRADHVVMAQGVDELPAAKLRPLSV